MCGYGRLCGAGRAIARSAAFVFFLGLFGAATRADEPADRATIAVFGDSQAQGLAGGLQRILIEDPRYRVLNRSHPGAALVHGGSEWLAPVERFASREKADIAVVMFGANDRLDMRDERGVYLHFRTDDWRGAYAARAAKILTLLANAGLKVIWCGNPIARSPTYSADMNYINDIYAEETARFGAQFVPLWTIIADGQGGYVAYGKDRVGTTQRLRADDGIHFTAAGYELIAEKIVGLFRPPPRMLGETRAGMALHFGIRIVAADKNKVVGEIDADDRHLNAGGIVHGGAYMAFADELGGHAAGLHLLPGTRTTTVESKTNFFRACRPGRLVGEAVPLHVGHRMIVVQTSIYGPDGKRAAIVTQTQLVLPRKGRNPPG